VKSAKTPLKTPYIYTRLQLVISYKHSAAFRPVSGIDARPAVYTESGDVEAGNTPHNQVELPLSWHCPWDQRPGDNNGSPLQSQHQIAQEVGVIYSILTGMDFFKGHRETVSGLEAVRNRLLGGLRDSMTEQCLRIDDRLKRPLSGALDVTKLDSRADELTVKEDICSGLRTSLREWNTSCAMVKAESFLNMPEPAAVHTPRWTTGARVLAP